MKTLPPLYFQITNEVQVKVTGDNYFVFLEEFDVCYGFNSFDENFNLFGDTFLKGLYVIHDQLDYKVAFGELSKYD